ncbi:MAG: DUF433 domain-containing protein [Geobacteraceae bacterium]
MKMTIVNFDRITIDPEQMNGQPCIRGTRITVKRVLGGLTVYTKWEELIAEFPELEKEDIRQALAFAAENIDDTIIVKEMAA